MSIAQACLALAVAFVVFAGVRLMIRSVSHRPCRWCAALVSPISLDAHFMQVHASGYGGPNIRLDRNEVAA